VNTLPEELQSFLREGGIGWTSAYEVTARSWSSSKRAFRICLDDGQLAKARLLLAGGSAERLATLLEVGGASRRCSRILVARGRCLLEEWVDGEPLAATTPRTVLVACGQALADIHTTPIRNGGLASAADFSGFERLRSDLLSLSARGWLTGREAATLESIAEAIVPPPEPMGLVHLDYCRDNLVLHAERGPVCIDNETVRVGPFALDLARTVTRWPLDGDSARHFIAGYLSGGGPADPAHLDYWTLVADAWSAALRIHHGHMAIEPHIVALRRRLGGVNGAS